MNFSPPPTIKKFVPHNAPAGIDERRSNAFANFAEKLFYFRKIIPLKSFALLNACYNAARTKPKEPPPAAHVDRTFDDWIREADECNLDYGTYRGLIKMGKTYDELKAVADRRTISVHAHGGATSKKNYRD